jgi:hypothetical protein
MANVLRRIEENDQTDEPAVHSTGQGGGLAPIRERCSEATLAEMVASFQFGTTVRELAVLYSMGESSVKRVLRQRGVSRRDRAWTPGSAA